LFVFRAGADENKKGSPFPASLYIVVRFSFRSTKSATGLPRRVRVMMLEVEKRFHLRQMYVFLRIAQICV